MAMRICIINGRFVFYFVSIRNLFLRKAHFSHVIEKVSVLKTNETPFHFSSVKNDQKIALIGNHYTNKLSSDSLK